MSQELINGLIIGKFTEYTEPKFHFTYYFFNWVAPWPYHGMMLHYAVTILAGFAVALGFYYRLAAVILFLGHSLLFLMEMAEYINHAYLYCLISFWMIWLPLENNKKPTAPAWTLYLILFHMGLAYFFGGIAKLNSDWISGTPMDLFLAARHDYPLGFIYKKEWAAQLFSYGGIVFDLLIVPLMMFTKTRVIGLIFSILFHFSNALMFGLATFPWYSLVLTTMFFHPSWPRRIPIFNKFLPEESQVKKHHALSPALLSVLMIYALIHLSVPLRHWLYSGDTSWTEEGHMFAWRMMLRSKQGVANFMVQNHETKQFERIILSNYLSPRQINDMSGNPDLIIQFAHHIRDEYQEKYKSTVSVYASSRVSLNGRKKVELIKPGTDLATKERSLLSYDWINPLEETQIQFTSQN